MKKSIILIHNNTETATQIMVNLSSPNTEVINISSMSVILHSIDGLECCLVIIDAAISAKDGHQILAAIRKLTASPILVISSQSSHVERLKVFQAGAHAYIGKPYTMEEIMAQAYALIQLYCGVKPRQELCYTLSIGKDLVIDPNSRQVSLNGKSLRLTRKEFDLLFYLASNPGQVFSREQLYSRVWDDHSAFNVDEVVKTHIKTLRQKLSISRNEYIINVWGIGYRFHTAPDDE